MNIDLRLQIIHLFSDIEELLRELDTIGQVVGTATPLPFVDPRSAAGVVRGTVA